MRAIRKVVAGTTYLITKKCMDDRFIIVPSDEVNAVLLYCLLVSAKKYGVKIHAFCFMSNHFHLVVTDALGQMPDFMSHFLTNSSKALKACLSTIESVWSQERYSAVTLLDLDAAFRKIAYTILNPTIAGLCENPSRWPGVTSARFTIGTTIRCSRPDGCFSSKKTIMPESVEGTLEPVDPWFGEDRTMGSSLARVVATALNTVLVMRRRHRHSFATPEHVLETPRHRRTKHPVRTRTPRHASRDPRRLAQAIEEERAFHFAHAAAKKCYLAGRVDTVFPLGTYGYRRLLGVSVEEAAA